MMPGVDCSGVMLQSEKFCRLTRTLERRRFTWASNFEGIPYSSGGSGRPICLFDSGMSSGAAVAVVPARPTAPALPATATESRKKDLRLGLCVTESRACNSLRATVTNSFIRSIDFTLAPPFSCVPVMTTGDSLRHFSCGHEAAGRHCRKSKNCTVADDCCRGHS